MTDGIAQPTPPDASDDARFIDRWEQLVCAIDRTERRLQWRHSEREIAEVIFRDCRFSEEMIREWMLSGLMSAVSMRRRLRERGVPASWPDANTRDGAG
jgi:hypothetical protein